MDDKWGVNLYPEPTALAYSLVQENCATLPGALALVARLYPPLLFRLCQRILARHYADRIHTLTTGQLLIDMIALNHDNVRKFITAAIRSMEDLLIQWPLLQGYVGEVWSRADRYQLRLIHDGKEELPLHSRDELLFLKVVRPLKGSDDVYVPLLSPERVERYSPQLTSEQLYQKLTQEEAFGFALPQDRPEELFVVGPALLRSLLRWNVAIGQLGPLWYVLASLHFSLSLMRVVRMVANRLTGPLSQALLSALTQALLETLRNATESPIVFAEAPAPFIAKAISTGQLSLRFQLESAEPFNEQQRTLIHKVLPIQPIDANGLTLSLNTVTLNGHELMSEGGVLGLQFYYVFVNLFLQAAKEFRALSHTPNMARFYWPLSLETPSAQSRNREAES